MKVNIKTVKYYEFLSLDLSTGRKSIILIFWASEFQSLGGDLRMQIWNVCTMFICVFLFFFYEQVVAKRSK